MTHMLELSANARLAERTLALETCDGIPAWMFHSMDPRFLEKLAGAPEGSYPNDPDGVYLAAQRAAGVCMIDQYLAGNVLSMGAHGYENGTAHQATTGAAHIELDGIIIDDADKVVEHLERIEFPKLEAQIAATAPSDDEAVARLIQGEQAMQAQFGPEILKAPYGEGWGGFPILRYGAYGYVHYLTAYVIYPEIMERDFALQADLYEKTNAIAARAIRKGNLPKVIRLDHDMADNSGPLVDIRSLERSWFPHFARSIKPLVDAGIRCIWHCDGNLMSMIPGLLEAGIRGFQGFQYEAGMDYERICKMTDRDGEPLMIWGGVSVTRTLPLGTPDEVRKEIKWLVENGPPVGLFLGGSSSITPGVPWANLEAMLEGLAYYRTHGHRG